MTNVWWLGNGTRTISVADWASADITGDEVVWDKDNGWAVDQTSLNSDQLQYLQSDQEFLLNQTGVRSVSPSPSNFPGFSYSKMLQVIQDLIEQSAYGKELGYAESLGPFSTTNNDTSDEGLQGAVIPGLSVTVVGTGRPVSIFYNGMAATSDDASGAAATLLVNGSGSVVGLASASTPVPDKFYSFSFRERRILDDGVSYTFEIGMWNLDGTTLYGLNRLSVVGL